MNTILLRFISIFLIGILLSGCMRPLYDKYAPREDEYSFSGEENGKQGRVAQPSKIWLGVNASGSIGVKMRSELDYLMSSVRDPKGRSLELSVTPNFSGDVYHNDFGARGAGSNTRVVNLNYVLQNRDTGDILLRDQTRATAAYEMRSNSYGNEASVQDADERAAKKALRIAVDRVQAYLGR